MAWGRVDDNLAFHPKVMQAGNEAMGLWIRSLSWCAQQLTDGHVPDGIIHAFGGRELSHRLVDAGLWHQVDGGFEFNDWHDYQPTRESVMAEREAARSRMARVRANKRVSSPDVRANIDRSSDEVRLPHPIPSHPSTPKGVESTKRAQRLPEDFSITPEMSAWAQGSVPGMDIKAATEQFMDYWHSAGGANARKLDWEKAWKVWMRRDYIKTPAGQRTVPGVPQPPTKAQLEAQMCSKHYGYPLPCDRCARGDD